MENKYQRGKIYKITSSQTDKVYIGSTINTLNNRLSQHRCNFKKGKSASSCEITQYDDAKIELIEIFRCNSKIELLVRERYYIENTQNVINKKIPSRTTREWRVECPEKVVLSRKKYTENNREKINDRSKKYKQNNRDKIKAIRDYQNTWCGNHRHNNHNNLLRISPDIFN